MSELQRTGTMRLNTRVPAWMLVGASIVLLGISSNWIYQYTSVLQVIGGGARGTQGAFTDKFLLNVPAATPSIGGWPYVYFVRNVYATAPDYTVWSWPNLFKNFSFFVALLTAFAFYELWQRNKLRQNTPPLVPTVRRVNLLDLVLVTTLAAVGFAYWKSVGIETNRQRLDVAKNFQKDVRYISETWLPTWAVAVVPKWTYNNFVRVREVNASNADNQTVQAILKLNTLQRLRLGGSTYDLRLLDNLASLPLLIDLRVSGRRLDARSIAAVSSCKQLQSLSLIRTNVTAAGIEALGDMPRLRELDLTGTDVVLADLGRPKVAQTLEALTLPHPNVGQGDSCVIRNWPRLRDLACSEYDTLPNSTPVSLELCDLPELRSLMLDQFQMFDLTLDKLPKLSSIIMRADQPELRRKKGQPLVSMLWARRLTARSLPALTQVTVAADELESLDLQCGAKTTLKLVKLPHVNSTLGPGNSTIQTMEESTLPLFQRQRWIDGVANCTGSLRVDLSSLPLAGVVLDRLIDNRAIKVLDLSGSGLLSQEIVKLAEMPNLEELTLNYLPVDGNTIQRLSERGKSLRKLTVMPQVLDRLEIQDNDRLETLFPRAETTGLTPPMIFPSQGYPLAAHQVLRLVNVTKLAESFSFDKRLVKLHLEKVPALTGLSFFAPWKEGTVMVGLRDLKHFAASGRLLDDQIAAEVLKCNGLKKLTLAYTSITPAMLRRIGTLSKLEFLVLTGSQATDEVIAALSNLKELQTLALERTQITSRSIDHLARLPKLTRLELDGRHITAGNVSTVAKLEYLTYLKIPRAKLEPQAIAALGTLKLLEHLDLSFCSLSTESLSELVRGFPQLRVLSLRGSVVDGSAVKAIAQKHPALMFDLVDAQVDPASLEILLRTGRATTEPVSPVGQRGKTSRIPYELHTRYSLGEGEIPLAEYESEPASAAPTNSALDRDDPDIVGQ